MEEYLINFKNCLQKEAPYCTAECPFHLDILDFIGKIKKGSLQGAFKTYRNAVGFPLIASALCSEPCKGVCPRKEIDAAIDLKRLEKACISFTKDRGPTDYNLPMKKKKVAVIGAGISGLACALRLCMKKYEVELFEATDRIGGSLWELMDPEIFQRDIAEQFKYEKYALHLNTWIQTKEDIADGNFDAVYVATGTGGEDFGLLSVDGGPGDPYCLEHNGIGWFAGGGLICDEPIYALAGGLYAATVLDNYLKTGNLKYPEQSKHTAMCLDSAKLRFEAPVTSSVGEEFNAAEAQREASRCMECQCDYCRTYCDLTEFYKKWPLRIRDEVLATTLPGSAEVKATPAKRLLSTCNQCGLCKETCPQDIDLGGLILAGRKSMHQQKKAPWVFHDFWLRDMDFANSERASISKAAPENLMKDQSPNNKRAGYAFFPGCQLGASDPDLVVKTYEYLLGKDRNTGLILRCCGAPAEWSGDEEKFDREIAEIRASWEVLGKPTLILACPTCEKKFKSYMADIPVVSLYEIMSDWGTTCVFDSDLNNSQIHYSIFDPCASRNEPAMKEAVRDLARKRNLILEPLPENNAYARCCGYGGQPGIANSEYQDYVTKKRIVENAYPYITYCINCRDIFLDAGKEAVHILELILYGNKRTQTLSTISERRRNRIALKSNLMRKFWDEEWADMREESSTIVDISSDLANKLHREKILEEDIIGVIEFCERTGRKTVHPEDGIYSGYGEVGYMTYWVEYKVDFETGVFKLINAYSHRMKIELEPVWNGKKI